MVVHSARGGQNSPSPSPSGSNLSFYKSPLFYFNSNLPQKSNNWTTGFVREKWVFKTDRWQTDKRHKESDQIKNILRTYSASLKLPRNIYFRSDFTHEKKPLCTLQLSILMKKQKKPELQALYNKDRNY